MKAKAKPETQINMTIPNPNHPEVANHVEVFAWQKDGNTNCVTKLAKLPFTTEAGRRRAIAKARKLRSAIVGCRECGAPFIAPEGYKVGRCNLKPGDGRIIHHCINWHRIVLVKAK